MLGFEIPVGGEQFDVRALVTAVIDCGAHFDEITSDEATEQISSDDGHVKVTKTDGGWIYSVGAIDTFIDEGAMQDDGATLHLEGAMAWGQVHDKAFAQRAEIHPGTGSSWFDRVHHLRMGGPTATRTSDEVRGLLDCD